MKSSTGERERWWSHYKQTKKILEVTGDFRTPFWEVNWVETASSLKAAVGTNAAIKWLEGDYLLIDLADFE